MVAIGAGALEVLSLGPTDVRFGSKADICNANRHVRFIPESGHSSVPFVRMMKPDPVTALPHS